MTFEAAAPKVSFHRFCSDMKKYPALPTFHELIKSSPLDTTSCLRECRLHGFQNCRKLSDFMLSFWKGIS